MRSRAIVEVEVDLAQGLPVMNTVGLPDAAVQEARERVRFAIKNAGCLFPMKRIRVNLAPAELEKEYSYAWTAISKPPYLTAVTIRTS